MDYKGQKVNEHVADALIISYQDGWKIGYWDGGIFNGTFVELDSAETEDDAWDILVSICNKFKDWTDGADDDWIALQRWIRTEY